MHFMLSSWFETVRGLLQPRRLFPVCVITGALLAAQLHFSGDQRSLWVGVALVFTTWLSAPWMWRILFRSDLSAPQWVVRLLAYAVIGIVLTGVSGWLLPLQLGLGPTYLTSPINLLVTVALFWVGG